MKPKFSLIIVNYNTEVHIIELLQNLAVQSYDTQRFEVIVVNNVQNEVLTTYLAKHHFIFNITVVSSKQNIGFGRAMNLGASYAIGEHLLITNPDIIISDEQFLEKLAQSLRQYPDYGVATCRILNDKGVDTSEFYHYEFEKELGRDITTQIAWLLGAFLVISTSVFQRLGGFDPEFFMYCEDEELCLRVRQLGLSFIKFDELSIYHVGGASEPNKDYAYFYRWYRSRILFAYKFYDKQTFDALILQLITTSRKKIHLYKLFAKFSPRYQQKYQQWQTMFDIVQKVKTQGISWLAFEC